MDNIKHLRKVLLVDDKEQNLNLMERILNTEGYKIFKARDGRESIHVASKIDPDVIIMDIMMPEMNGYEATEILKKDMRTSKIPVVVVTALTEPEHIVKALEIGADDIIRKPFDVLEVRARVKSQMKLKDYNTTMIDYQHSLEKEVHRRTSEVRDYHKKFKTASLETIYLLSRAAEYKDRETGTHIKRMSNYAAMLAEKIGFGQREVETLLYTSSMHDVGKIGIPDRILLKAGPLNENEWRIMKNHTIIGSQILQSNGNEIIKQGAEIALTHHEKWDGTGYPHGLKGEEIPLCGRICSVADVFDALTSLRPYKEAFSLEKSLDIMSSDRGKAFDPQILDIFFSMEDKIIEIMDYYGEEAEDMEEDLYSAGLN